MNRITAGVPCVHFYGADNCETGRCHTPRPINSIVINGIEYEFIGRATIRRLGTTDDLVEISAGTVETMTLKEKHPPV